MRILANENVPKCAVVDLRSQGHDVAWMGEDAPSTADEFVIGRAMAEDRVLLTLDKDFGELVIKRGLPVSCGLVLLRVPPVPAIILAEVRRAFADSMVGPGKFVVVEPGRIRERLLLVRSS